MKKVSRHANERIRERCGANKKSVNRMAQNALERGLKHSETTGNLNKYLNGVFLKECKATDIRVYNGKVWLFTKDTLITVLQIPSNLTKDVEIQLKKKKEKNKSI